MGAPPRVKAAVGTGGGGAVGGAVAGAGEIRPVAAGGSVNAADACGHDMVPLPDGDAGVADEDGLADDTPRASEAAKMLEGIGTASDADEDEVGRAVESFGLFRAGTVRWCGVSNGGICSGAGRLAGISTAHNGGGLYPNRCLPAFIPYSFLIAAQLGCVPHLFLSTSSPHIPQ